MHPLIKAFPPAKNGYVWWTRPVYWTSSFSLESPNTDFRWSCAFCPHTETSRDNYGVVGFECRCSAKFIGDDSFGTWMAKEMPEEWAKGREEVWA